MNSFLSRIKEVLSLKYAINIVFLVVFNILVTFLMGYYSLNNSFLLIGLSMISAEIIMDILRVKNRYKIIIYLSLLGILTALLFVNEDLFDGFKVSYNQLVERMEELTSYSYSKFNLSIAQSAYRYYIDICSVYFGIYISLFILAAKSILNKYSYLLIDLLFMVIMIYFSYFPNSLLFALMILLSLVNIQVNNNVLNTNKFGLCTIIILSILTSSLILTCSNSFYKPLNCITNISETIRNEIEPNKEYINTDNVITNNQDVEKEENDNNKEENSSSSTSEGATNISKVPYLLFIIISFFLIIILFPVGYFLYRIIKKRIYFKKLDSPHKFVFLYKSSISYLKLNVIKSSNLGYDGYYEEVKDLGEEYLSLYKEMTDLYYKVVYGNLNVGQKEIEQVILFKEVSKRLCFNKVNLLKRIRFMMKEVTKNEKM